MTTRYDQRGVSSGKEEVHNAIRHSDPGIFPGAFCKVLPDITGGNPNYCNILHADTAGTKAVLAYLYWRETGNISVFSGIIQDAIVMNLDDLVCIGCTDNILLSNTIGRNKFLVPGEVISEIIKGMNDFSEKMRDFGVRIFPAGGETADVGDIVRTLDVGVTAFARMKRKDVIVPNICPGDVIVGLSSDGQAVYEDYYNSGIGSNGLTSARHDVLKHVYAEKYPEIFDPNMPPELVYVGIKSLTDKVEVPTWLDPLSQMPQSITDIGRLLLSPTRTYVPVVRKILSKYKKSIHGIIHCSGGGQTKVLKFAKNVRIVKNNLFDLPPVFKMIQESSSTSWEEMYKVFNMGHRMEFYLPKHYARKIIKIASEFQIHAQIIGHVEEAQGSSVLIKSPYGEFEYK